MEVVKTVMLMIASIGAILIGLDFMAANIGKLFSKGFKKIFNKVSKNKLAGLGIGTAATAILQSSAATTILVVGFVNTGILGLSEAAPVIMGANIGTCITALIASLNGIDVASFLIAFVGIGFFIKFFSKNQKISSLGLLLAGFGLLFLGLYLMKYAINASVTFKGFLESSLSSLNGAWGAIVLFLIGVIFTALVESSSLVTTIVVGLATAGIYVGAGGKAEFDNIVLFLIVGANIGTCITALLSASSSSLAGKRAAMIHLLFNTFGAIIFIIVLILWPSFMQDVFGFSKAQPGLQVALFHTFFNVVSTIIFLPFSNLLVKMSCLIIKEKEKSSKIKFTYLDERIMKNTALATHQVRLELAYMYEYAYVILQESLDAFFKKEDIKDEIDTKIKFLEEYQSGVVKYLVKLNVLELSIEDECSISSFYKTLNDIQRIAEIGDNIGKYARQVINEHLSFSDDVTLQLAFMRKEIDNLKVSSHETFLNKDLSLLGSVDEYENHVDEMRAYLISDHYDRLNKGTCKPENSGVFVNLVNNLERAADHMVYIAYSVKDALELKKN